MVLKMFSIYDQATEAFNQPFFMLTKAEALRAFIKMANDDTTQMFHAPNDFHLYLLGSYDNSTAQITQDKGIEDLGSAFALNQKANVVNIEEKSA